MKPRIILASSSPQRMDIMRELGIDFEAVSMDVNEVIMPTPEETVQANARLKAKAAYDKFPDAIVIAADTVISHAGKVLGKPKNTIDAESVLSAMAGSDVKAVSAVAVVNATASDGYVAVESAVAHLRELTHDDIAWYIGTKEPLTRAGSLGISRYGDIFIERIDGAYSCFAGLPKRALLAALSKANLATLVLPDGMSAIPAVATTNLEITNFKMP